jgi:diguanylate cyclase (GGDEF)-like protein
MTTGIAVAALALGAIAVLFFAIAIRRWMTRQTEVVETMLRRYDDRLATFAQTLNDTMTAIPARTGSEFGAGEDSEPMMRALEIAVSETSADGAVALVTGGSGAPVVATIGLSEAETNHIARMGFPDYRGARAIEVAFSGDIDAPEGSPAIRSGLVVPLLEGEPSRSLMGVLTRDEARRFSEDDVTALDDLVTRARPAITRSLHLREPDVVPELDLLTGLYDRHSFESVLDHQIARARLAQRPLFLLLIDVDRLTTLNAKIGRLAADGALLAIAERLRGHVDRFDYTFRLAGGRFAVIRRGGTATDAHELFDTFRSAISSQPLDEAGFVSVSAGISELLPIDDAASLVGRAEESLVDAKQLRRGAAADGA